MQRPATLAELQASGYRTRSVRDEMRENLLALLASEEGARAVFGGIVGYEETVIPEIENAVLSGHHMVLLGERGQAKTRLIRALINLLDEQVPAIAGCEIHDDPFAPVCAVCRRRAAAEGGELPVVWIARDARYGEKLATPDVTVADLIGEIDPIKIAEGRYLSDEEAIHFGIIARTHRGIFAINELPDLTEKVQVGLFNLMEERDLQIKGHKIRLPLDVVVVATANPEDYTSRGRIVTPLKDRFDVQIRTHYPRTVAEEIAIMEQEVAGSDRSGRPVRVPDFMKEVIARMTMEARKAPEVNQSSGVSVRVSINNYETILANAEKRAVRCGESEIVPRISDLHALFASTNGKLELEYGLDSAKEAAVVDRLLSVAVKTVFDSRLSVAQLQPVLEYMGQGWGVAVSDSMPAADYLEGLSSIPGLREVIEHLGPFESPGLTAAAIEFVFEGLHLLKKLNRERQGGRLSYAA
ncbi:MAG TPA: AAA family ATPase [Candidatus Limnocylindrales bacterium]|nr:AAA family ATPase [Candidatus Limnocylindrales bacterium]